MSLICKFSIRISFIDYDVLLKRCILQRPAIAPPLKSWLKINHGGQQLGCKWSGDKLNKTWTEKDNSFGNKSIHWYLMSWHTSRVKCFIKENNIINCGFHYLWFAICTIDSIPTVSGYHMLRMKTRALRETCILTNVKRSNIVFKQLNIEMLWVWVQKK